MLTLKQIEKVSRLIDQTSDPSCARNFQMHIDDNDLKCKYLCRDNDTKYVKDFDAIFTSSNCKIKRIVLRSPNLQAHVERVIQTIKHEVLN